MSENSNNSNNSIRFTYTFYGMTNNVNRNLQNIENLENEQYDDEDDYDEDDNESLEYTPHDNFFSGNHNTTFQCHICSTRVNILDFDDHLASHITDIAENATTTFTEFLQPISTISQLAPLSSISSLFGLSNSTPFNNLTPFSNPNNLTGISFSNLFHSSHSFPLSLSETLNLSYQIFNDNVFNEYEANLRLGDLIGKVEVGVSNIEDISKIINKDILEDQTTCPICIENIKQTKNECRELICSHKYCDECISKWLSTSKRCPVCNVDLEDKLLNMR